MQRFIKHVLTVAVVLALTSTASAAPPGASRVPAKPNLPHIVPFPMPGRPQTNPIEVSYLVEEQRYSRTGGTWHTIGVYNTRAEAEAVKRAHPAPERVRIRAIPVRAQ